MAKEALYMILIIALFAGALYSLSALHIFSGLGTIAPISGVTVEGIGQVAVLSNWQGISGPWWLAQVTLGGTQTLNVQNLGGTTYSASQLNTNSSYICGNTCQQNNMEIRTTQSFVKYTAQSAGSLVNEYYIADLANGNAYLTYDSCIGQNLGGLKSTTTPTSQLVDFTQCLYGNAQSYSNYNTSCKTKGGVPLVYSYSGGALYSGTVKQMGCYQLNTVSYANIYGLTSASPEYTVYAKINSQSTSISNNQSSNTTNPNLWIYNIGSGFAPQSAPSETTVALVQYLPINTSTGFKQNVTAYTTLIEGNGGQGLVSQIGAYQGGLQSTFSKEVNYQTAIQAVSTADGEITGSLHQSYVNTQFANASIIYGSGTQGFYSIKGPVIGIKLPDPAALYTRPNIVLAIKASEVGLYLGVSNMTITSITIGNFRSGSTGDAYVTVQNTGNAQGGYTIRFNSSISSSGISTAPASSSGILSPNDENVSGFTVYDNSNINSNTTQSIGFTVCPSPQVAGGPKCVSKQVFFTLDTQCNNNQQFNAGTCQTLTSITAPTTSIPQSNQNGSSTTAPTTTVPCDINNGNNCNGITPPSFPLWELLLIIIVIVAVIIIIIMVAKR